MEELAALRQQNERLRRSAENDEDDEDANNITKSRISSAAR